MNEKINQLSTIAEKHANEIAQIEQEVNRLMGGEASVAEIVAIMIDLGWMAPDETARLRARLGQETSERLAAQHANEMRGARGHHRRISSRD